MENETMTEIIFENGSRITTIDSGECVRGKRAKIDPLKDADYLDWYLANKAIVDEVLEPFCYKESVPQENQQLYVSSQEIDNG
jgi:hypothetical protein